MFWLSCSWHLYNRVSELVFVGWYWGAITAGEAHSVLQGALEGTFLVRDSSHPLYMLTLSVKTGRGPTNVRIEYSHGRFRLDSSTPARTRLLAFPDVPSLVQHYVGSGKGKEVSEEDEKDSKVPPVPKECAVLLKLKRPLHRPQAFPSLQHLTRLAINRNTTCPERLPLPRPLLQYLQDYPFQLWKLQENTYQAESNEEDTDVMPAALKAWETDEGTLPEKNGLLAGYS